MSSRPKRNRAPVGLKIRFAVIDLLYRNNGKSVKIPSIADFAEKYQISLSTVKRELKKLEKEGYVQGKKGRGVYTVASTKWRTNQTGIKFIGLLYGDGRLFSYSWYDWNMMFAAGKYLSSRNDMRFVNLNSGDVKEIVEEINFMDLDGLIVIKPSNAVAAAVSQLKKKGMKVVSLLTELKGIPSITPDFKAAGMDLFERLQKQKVKSMLWMICDDFYCKLLKYVEKSAKRAKYDLHVVTISTFAELEEKFQHCKENSRIPDSICIHGAKLKTVREMMKANDIHIPLLIGEEGYAQEFPDYDGLLIHIPFERIAELVEQAFESPLEQNLHYTWQFYKK